MTLRQSEKPVDTTPRPTADQIGMALRFLGVKKVSVDGSLVVATNKGITVNIRLCRDNIPFVWWTTKDGEQHICHSVRTAIRVLGVGGFVRSGTILTRAMKSLGLTNRRANFGQDFYVHGEYNSAGERVRTFVDFRSTDASRTVMEAWDELKPALDLTGYCFKLKKYTERSCYLSN